MVTRMKIKMQSNASRSTPSSCTANSQRRPIPVFAPSSRWTTRQIRSLASRVTTTRIRCPHSTCPAAYRSGLHRFSSSRTPFLKTPARSTTSTVVRKSTRRASADSSRSLPSAATRPSRKATARWASRAIPGRKRCAPRMMTRRWRNQKHRP